MHTPSSCRCASAVGLAEHSNSLRIGQRPSLRSSFVPPPARSPSTASSAWMPSTPRPRVVSMHGTHSRQAAPGDPAQTYRRESYVPAGHASPLASAGALRKNKDQWRKNECAVAFRSPSRLRPAKTVGQCGKLMCCGLPPELRILLCSSVFWWNPQPPPTSATALAV